MILLHSVDVYQHIHALWTKYCTALDSLDPLQCNNTVFVGILWISGLSGGFICEFLQFVIVYLVVGGLAKTLTVPAVLIVS